MRVEGYICRFPIPFTYGLALPCYTLPDPPFSIYYVLGRYEVTATATVSAVSFFHSCRASLPLVCMCLLLRRIVW